MVIIMMHVYYLLLMEIILDIQKRTLKNLRNREKSMRKLKYVIVADPLMYENNLYDENENVVNKQLNQKDVAYEHKLGFIKSFNKLSHDVDDHVLSKSTENEDMYVPLDLLKHAIPIHHDVSNNHQITP